MSRWLAAMMLIGSAGCGGLVVRADAGSETSTAQDASFDASGPDVMTSDSAPGLGCLAPGNATIRASVDVPPGVVLGSAQLWVAAMCVSNGVERAVSVVVADDPTGVTTLSGLGAGTYVVRASALVVPGARSPEIFVGEGAMNVTQLTLARSEPPLRLFRTAVGPLSDAGTVQDAGSEVDAGSSAGTVLLETPITRPGATDRVGTLAIRLVPRDAQSFDVAIQVRNECVDGCALSTSGVELQVSRDGRPLTLGVAPFSSTLVGPGAAATTQPTTMMVPAPLAGSNLELGVALFGSVQSP